MAGIGQGDQVFKILQIHREPRLLIPLR
jgi:hypothetical protein